ncbi:MarR family winged helix-turn-helix transcriptional regulator [Naumannella halotolerans]|uniref:DNA-binding MarR family transcriptional regulator n=1 Tax=Naumannella halotolerans TaxID=993414 RepID=A0A4R7J1M2_9ACTN|nr:MarR family transcriptional regulator [Naumannella halotolerans]TDT31051.1 DNA-binding MarR family transcriptional regulator [Naumannella halotolerans]
MADPDQDLLALENQLCYALAVASRRVIGLYRPLLEPMGLTHPQYLVILALWQHDSLSLRELAERVSSDPPTLSPLVRRLADIGYVVRERSPHDERSLTISLTPTGRELRQQAAKIPPTILDSLQMDLDELRTVHQMLTGLIDRTQSAPVGVGSHAEPQQGTRS